MRVVIDWLTKAEGGREKPPSGEGPTSYRPQIRFVNDNDSTVDPLPWSLEVWKDSQSSGPDRWVADVNFMFDEAPHHELREGREFELCEGRRCVARGKILGESLITAGRDQAGASA